MNGYIFFYKGADPSKYKSKWGYPLQVDASFSVNEDVLELYDLDI